MIFRLAGHLDLFERLVECMYEITDRLTYFLCNKKPDHKNGEHLIIPEWASTLERNEIAFEARNKLHMVNKTYFQSFFLFIEQEKKKKIYFQLPNHLLEELASDVYDEVDRRETDASE